MQIYVNYQCVLVCYTGSHTSQIQYATLSGPATFPEINFTQRNGIPSRHQKVPKNLLFDCTLVVSELAIAIYLSVANVTPFYGVSTVMVEQE